ncbi:hypothetical protein BFP75_08945 [Maribacter sp. 4G9]|nr:hypothetical protein BFP75_08945 [Maribacter sp. 4G9]
MVGCQTKTEKTTRHTTWSHFGGSPDQSKYFESPSITKANVGELELLWSYPSGDDRIYFFSPIIVDSTMYVLGKNSSLIAIHAKTGEELWPHTDLPGITRRGINYWESEDRSKKGLPFLACTLIGCLLLKWKINEAINILIEVFGRKPVGIPKSPLAGTWLIWNSIV